MKRKASEEALECFYQSLLKEKKMKQQCHQAQSHYVFNQCGQSVLLIETILPRVLQFLCIESLFKLCSVSRKLAESLLSIVKQYPVVSIAFDSTNTLSYLRLPWHVYAYPTKTISAEIMRHIRANVKIVRIRTRHDPFLTEAEKMKKMSDKIRCDALMIVGVKEIVLEATEIDDVCALFDYFLVPQQKISIYCVVDPDKYFGRQWPTNLRIPDKTVALIEDLRGLKFASLKNLSIHESL